MDERHPAPPILHFSSSLHPSPSSTTPLFYFSTFTVRHWVVIYQGYEGALCNAFKFQTLLLVLHSCIPPRDGKCSKISAKRYNQCTRNFLGGRIGTVVVIHPTPLCQIKNIFCFNSHSRGATVRLCWKNNLFLWLNSTCFHNLECRNYHVGSINTLGNVDSTSSPVGQ